MHRAHSLRPLLILAALLFKFEAWLWDRIQPVLASLLDFIPWQSAKTQLAQEIEKRPPWFALILLAVPTIVLFPLKFLVVALLARRKWVLAAGAFGVAKTLDMGATAFVFDASKPKLLQIAWFKTFYEFVLRMRALADEQVSILRRRVAFWTALAGDPVRLDRFLRLLAALRRRARPA